MMSGVPGLGVFHNGKAVLQTGLVAGPAQGETGAEEISVLVPAVYPGGIIDDVGMDMGVVATGKTSFHR